MEQLGGTKDRRTTSKDNLPEGEKNLDAYLGKHVKKLMGLYIKMGTNYMSGLPDRLIIVYAHKPFFVELKSKGNKPTVKQLAIHRTIEKLGVKVGEPTPDGLFEVRGVECLGACGYAPMMQLGDFYKEHLTAAKIDQLIEDCKNDTIILHDK